MTWRNEVNTPIRLATDILLAAVPHVGPWVPLRDPVVSFQATVVGTGSVSATVVIEVSNDGVGALAVGTIGLSGTNSHSDGFVMAAACCFARARVTAISGTGAAVSVSTVSVGL